MATPSRIYMVQQKSPAEGAVATTRLVRCNHPSHALRHVADDLFTVAVATHDDLEALLPKGVKVERIGHEQQELPGSDE